MLPMELLFIQLIFAVICTGYSWFVKDMDNYTDIISGLVGVIFWWTSGLSVLSGVTSQAGSFSGEWLMWLFVAIGVIVALITFVKIVDAINAREKEPNVHMDFNYRI